MIVDCTMLLCIGQCSLGISGVYWVNPDRLAGNTRSPNCGSILFKHLPSEMCLLPSNYSNQREAFSLNNVISHLTPHQQHKRKVFKQTVKAGRQHSRPAWPLPAEGASMPRCLKDCDGIYIPIRTSTQENI